MCIRDSVHLPSREVENEGVTDTARPEGVKEQSDLDFPLPHKVPSPRPSTLSNVSSPSSESASSSSSTPAGTSSSSHDMDDDVADRDGSPHQSRTALRHLEAYNMGPNDDQERREGRTRAQTRALNQQQATSSLATLGPVSGDENLRAVIAEQEH